VRVNGARLEFRFRGKSGVAHEVELSDRRLASIVRHMLDLPGYELFCYVDEKGTSRPVESADVNEYIRSIAGDEFTSKDFRTWAGTLLCARALRPLAPPASASAGRRIVTSAIDAVAAQLRNTRSVCRRCYVHPAVIDAYLDGRLQKAMQGVRDEAGVTRLLRGKPNGQTSHRFARVRGKRQLRARSWQRNQSGTWHRRPEAAAAR